MSDLFDEGEEQRRTPPPEPRRSRALIITAAVLVVGFFGLTTFSAFWTNRAWYEVVGFSGVFTTLLWTRIGLFAVFGGVMGLVIGLNMYLAFRFRPLYRPPSPEQGSLDRYREVVVPIRLWLTIGVAALFGLFAGTSASSQWRQYLMWSNGGEFGSTDAYFNRDIGFYMFDLPWVHYVVDSAMAFTVIALLMAALVHYLFGGIQLQARHDRLSGSAQVHLSALLGVFVLLKALDYWLDRFDLVNNKGSLLTGMTYTGENAVLPAKNILLGIAVICAVLFFLNVWRRTWMLPSMGLALLVLSSILLGMIWPAIIQQFSVNPTEADKEAPYIKANIDATRAAYDLEDIEVEPYTTRSGVGNTGLAQLASSTSTVPLVDPQVVNRTFDQLQQVRAYYSVAPVLDVDRYDIDDTERALVLGVRELDQAGISEGARNWTNLHTVYTHGNGMIAAYANQRGADDIDEQSEIQWAEGRGAGQDALENLGSEGYEDRVYFGEQSPNYSVVGKLEEDSQDVELDLGDTIAEEDGTTVTYDGAGGVGVGNIFSELMFALRFGEPNFLLSGRVHGNSQVLYHREPAERVERVAPWLTVDADPYPAVIDGRIVWILDGYTTSDRYPQAERESFETMIDDSLADDSAFGTLPTDELNYVRNAVKATVDAYDGTVNLYAWDETDPMLEAWRNAFPGTVQDRDEIPDGVLEHLRYPEDMFKAQRYQFARYHVTDAGDFYRGSDRWAVPEDPYVAGSYQPPYRLFVDDPTAEGGETWSMTTVYNPIDRDNLAAFMSVDSDATGENYGRIRALQLPSEQVDGPGQVASDMANADNVRRELLAFNAGETKPTFGNLLTLPVSDGLMYVQPVYAVRQLSDASYPILQFVIVSYGGRVGIGNSLEQALADVLDVDPGEVVDPTPEPGGGPDAEPGTREEQIASLLAQAQQAFEDADAAYRDGDTVEAARKTEEARDHIEQAFELSELGGQGGGGQGDGGQGDGDQASGSGSGSGSG